MSEPDPPAPQAEETRALPWLSPGQETITAAFGGMGALVVGTMLASSGADLPVLEKLALLLCACGGLTSWFLPRPATSLQGVRLGSWAALGLALYLLGPIRLVELRAAHDLESGSRVEKKRAVTRLVRLGHLELRGADLREINFSEANLGNVSFKGAKLNYSNFERALLVESDLSGADLEGANFRGANLYGVTMEGTSFGKGAKAARCDQFTQLPKGYRCVHAAIVPGKPAASPPKADSGSAK